MKKSFLGKLSFLTMALVLSATLVQGASFTAVASGSWGATATWGGAVPSVTPSLDQITIPAGINVTMENNVTLNGALAQLSVQGTLSAAANTALTVTQGTVTGGGIINVGSVMLETGAILAFTGSLTTGTMTTSILSVQTAASLTVNQTLTLAAGILSLQTAGTLTLGNNATIVMSGGQLAVNGGTLTLSSDYNVTYTSASSTAGLELSGAGLKNVTINVSSGNMVTLSGDLTVNGTLTLSGGTLALNGKDLVLMGDVMVSGTGSVSSTAASNISLKSSGGMTNALQFSGSANAVNNLTIDVGVPNTAKIGGALSVTGTLQIVAGTLSFNDANLTLSGSVNGMGKLSGNAGSNLTINTGGGLSTALNFATGGQTLNNLTLNVGSGKTVTLASNLNLEGTLTLTGGSKLDISDLSLMMSGDMSGNGSLMVNSGSSLTINTSGGLTGAISLSGASIGTLAVNVGNANTVKLGNDLTVSGTLNLQSGTLMLNGNDLVISGSIAAAGNGVVSSTASSSISINTAGSVSGTLSFPSTGNIVNDFTVNIGSNGSLNVGSDMNVNGTLTLTNGKLNIGNYELKMGATSSITGGASGSYIVTGADGYLTMFLTGGAASAVTFPVGTASAFLPASVKLNAGSASGTVEVGVVQNVLAQGTTGIDLSANQHVVDATWNVESSVTSNLNMNLEVMWAPSAEVNGFDRTKAYISHYLTTGWDNSAVVSATAAGGGMFSIQRSNITSLSPFAVFDQSTTSGVADRMEESGFQIYPNPASDYLVLLNKVGAAAVYADIINMNGQVVSTHKLTSDNTPVSIEHLSQGHYAVKFYNEKTVVVAKFVKM